VPFAAVICATNMPLLASIEPPSVIPRRRDGRRVAVRVLARRAKRLGRADRHRGEVGRDDDGRQLAGAKVNRRGGVLDIVDGDA